MNDPVYSKTSPDISLLNGTVSGHMGSGCYILIFGFWWSCGFFYRYYTTRARDRQYRGTWRYWFVCKRKQKPHSKAVCCQHVPVECFAQMGIGLAQLGLEIWQGYDWQRHTLDWDSAMHISMCLLFISCAVIELMIYNRSCCSRIPQRVVYWTGSLMFTAVAAVFGSHLLHGARSNTALHIPVTVLFALVALVVILESFYTKSVILPCARALLVMVIGLQVMVFGLFIIQVEVVPALTIARLTAPSYVALWFGLSVLLACFMLFLSAFGMRLCVRRQRWELRPAITSYNVTEHLISSDSSA